MPDQTQLISYLHQTFGTKKSSSSSFKRREREASLAPSVMSASSSRESSQTSQAGYGLAAGNYEGIEIEDVKRRFYDSEAGMDFCTEFIIQDEETVMTM